MDYPISVVGKTENSWKSKNEWMFKISPSQDVLELAPFAIIQSKPFQPIKLSLNIAYNEHFQC